jgi:hypothetical protein
MPMPFVKLDTRILDSTLWLDAPASRLFITALLMAEPWELIEPMEQLEVRTLTRTGFVVPAGWYGWIPAAGVGIIRRSTLGDAEGYAALDALGSPDAESRSPEFEGRRLVRVDGGYLILNFMKFRDFDYGAKDRMRRLRERRNGADVRRNVTPVPPNVTQADSREQKAEAEKDTHTAPAADGSGDPPENLLPTDEAVLEAKDMKLPAAKREAKKQQRAAIRHLFGYYLRRTERSPQRYTLTSARMDKGLSRLQECIHKCNGNLAQAVQMMGGAIDALLASKFHTGQNDSATVYTDWIDHLCKSTEKFEAWLSKKPKPVRKVMSDFAEQLR